MPRWYGRGYRAFGARSGWYLGYGWPPQYRSTQLTPDEKKGAVYVGPCRCGGGPHAYYRLSDGRIAHAFSMAAAAPIVREEPASELERLRADNERLEARVKELEQRLGGQ